MPDGRPGGGGGGSILGVSGSFTGPATALEIVGKHCYAYSGVQAVTAETSLLDFKSPGRAYIVGSFLFSYLPASGDDFVYKIYFNEAIIQQYIVPEARAYTEPDNVIPVVIPAFTQVKATAENVASGTERDQIVSFVGELFYGDATRRL